MTGPSLSISLATIQDAHERLGRGILHRSLQEGIPAATVRAVVGSVGLDASPALVSLYGWRDGTLMEGVAAIDDVHFFPGFYLLSLGDAVANYRAFIPDDRWQAGWFPIFANGGGDFYLVDLGQAEAHPIRHFRIDESEHPIEFDSLEALLMTLAEAFQRGVFFVDADGYLEMDDLDFGDLAAKLNPDVEWWQN